MAESEQDKIFRTMVIPIMDKVRDDLQARMSKEMCDHSNSLTGLMAGAVGPDGGMSASQTYSQALRHTGEWNSKTAEDYVGMVKQELQKQHVTVDADMERMMIEKMVQDKIPRSSIEYVLHKAAANTLFHLPQEVAKSPLELHIESEAEKRYNPSPLEKEAGVVLGSATDLACMGGFGSGWKAAAAWVGKDSLFSHFFEEGEDRSDVPTVVRPGCEEEYREALQEQNQQPQPGREPEIEARPVEESPAGTVPSEDQIPHPPQEVQSNRAEQTNTDGWQGLLTSFGLNGISDIGRNLGYVMAVLPDMIVGLFTGKTKSVNIKDNLMPIASIVAGMFTSNPILKMVLIGMGGLNLINKSGHEALDNFRSQEHPDRSAGRVNYRTYADEALNSRISNPEIRANCLIATIDKVPCTIALTDRVIDAYLQGALPLNTLANAVLAKNDRMRQMASENYDTNERQAIVRPLAQR